MKLLLIKGDDDYAACSFEDQMGVTRAKELIAQGTKIEGESFRGEIFAFSQVDPAFLTWLNIEMLDYDDCKHKNFYVIEE